MSSTGKPRVRFAPSPTGDLHVGNARTAFFNWLFARHHGGELILRIEDTDRLRTSEAFERRIIEDLRWLAIDWDEGPEKGGSFGPYHQSGRIEIYDRYLSVLVQEEKVYPCYCSEEELDAERSMLLARGLAPRYSGKCRNLTGEKRKSLEGEGRRPAWRFRVDEGTIEFDDLIRGRVTFNAADIGDFIIVRSNGIPAYNFAVVIDDHLMEISHVIRGEDHLSNTAIQLLLYKTFGFEPPVFAHHSLILGKDRSKLSKRHGAVAVAEFRKKGILPGAFVNYLALLGSSYGEGREILSIGEIVEEFSLERVGKGGAVFDLEKLEWVNAQYIRRCGTAELTDLLIPFLREAGYDPASQDRARLEAIVEAVKGNLHALSDVGGYVDVFYDDRYQISGDAEAVLKEKRSGEVLKALREALTDDGCPEKNPYAFAVALVEEKTGLKGKQLFMPIRAAVTGKTWGPELDRVFDILGRDALLRRVEGALDAGRR